MSLYMATSGTKFGSHPRQPKTYGKISWGIFYFLPLYPHQGHKCFPQHKDQNEKHRIGSFYPKTQFQAPFKALKGPRKDIFNQLAQTFQARVQISPSPFFHIYNIITASITKPEQKKYPTRQITKYFLQNTKINLCKD